MIRLMIRQFILSSRRGMSTKFWNFSRQIGFSVGIILSMPLWLTEHGQAVPLSRAPQPITTAQPSTALSIGSEANLPEHLLSAVDARLKLPSTANLLRSPFWMRPIN